MIHSDFDLDSKARCSLSFRYLADAIIGVGRKYWRVSTARAYSTHLRSATAGRQRDACFASTKSTSTPLLTDFANRSTSQFVNRTQPFDSIADPGRFSGSVNAVAVLRKAYPHRAGWVVWTRVDGEGLRRFDTLELVFRVVSIGWIGLDRDNFQGARWRRFLLAADGRRVKRDQRSILREARTVSRPLSTSMRATLPDGASAAWLTTLILSPARWNFFPGLISASRS